MKLFIVLTIICGFLTACGKGGGGSSNSAAASTKSIFSKWTADNEPSLDFTGGQFGSSTEVTILAHTGAICKANLTFIGDQSSGIYTILNAYWAGGGSSDPGCSSLNGGGNYDLVNSTLTICEGSDCIAYH